MREQREEAAAGPTAHTKGGKEAKRKSPDRYCILTLDTNDFSQRLNIYLSQSAKQRLRGHCDIVGNERADELARAGVELATTAKGSLSHALRKSKEKIQKSWVKEWKASPKTGRYAMANRFPPSLKPTAHFKSLKREIFGRVTQCRTGHCFTGEYYSRFSPSGDVEVFQTRREPGKPAFRASIEQARRGA
ncbi:hypothetical protein B0H14DRAFT_2631047 [Mycena olivaceomarginata]|nr:hypothetical protein B0H14DRAFT_2631047 [Mycena olivaceomarginata]